MAVSPACKSFVGQLSPFVDGELRVDQRVQIERHVASCPDCAARVGDLRAQSSLIRVGFDMLADEVDFRAFSRQVMAKITPARVPAWERLRLVFSELLTYRLPVMMIGAAASAAVGLAAVVLATRSGGPPEGYGSPRAIVQAISTDADAHSAPLLLTTDSGDSIVWFVDHIHVNGESQLKQEVDSGPQPGNKGGPERNGGDL